MPLTPVSPLPFESFQVVIAAVGTPVEAAPQPYTNTYQIKVQNNNAAGGGVVLVQIQYLGTPPAAPALPLPTNSVQVLPQQVVTLTIGSEGNRQAIRDRATWAALEGANLSLVFAALTTAATPTVTYVQNLGGAGTLTTGNP